MDKVFSTRMDEAVVHALDSLAATLRTSKKWIVEEAIRLYIETVEQRPDSIEVAFGAWRRSASPEQLHRQMRTALGDSVRRHEHQGPMSIPLR